MKCPYCNSEITDNSAFCSECGQRVRYTESLNGKSSLYWNEIEKEMKRDESIQFSDKKKSKLGKRVLLIGIIAVGGIGWLLLKNNIGREKQVLDISKVLEKSDEVIEDETDISESSTSKLNFPFEQKYWVIFTEGSRGDRVEASSIDSTLSSEEIYIVWDSALYLNDMSESSMCNQYFLEDNDEWEQIGEYSIFSDNATNIIASNLDIYDSNGELILSKSTYEDVDWDLINSYR